MYATRAFAPFDVIGEYVGRVVPPAVCGDYVASIDQDDGRLPHGSSPWGVDSALYGSEWRHGRVQGMPSTLPLQGLAPAPAHIPPDHP